MKLPRTLSFALRGVFALALLPSLSHAEEGAKIKYIAPPGFAGHTWGELRTRFDRLPSEPIGVGAAWMRSLETQKSMSDTSCALNGKNPGPHLSGAYGGCDFQSTLMNMRTDFDGGGFYVLSEYAIDGQGFRFGAEGDGVVFHPVVYQFCANWQKNYKKKVQPPNFDALNQFCGMKFMFQSETREQLRSLPGDQVTNYDRVLDKLLAKYGRPDGFVRRGRVYIEKMDGDPEEAVDRKFSIWRWCPAHGNGFHTDCPASIVLSLDPVTGVGTVMYSTPLLWEFAYARENYDVKGDRLYAILHARK